VAPERRRIGYVPQEGSLFPHLTVEANVGFGLPARERRGGQAARLLETVGLGGLGRRYPHQLSGGQQQRVALARALAIEPTVVLLDEPFASLDAHLRASVRADVQDIFRRAGTTAVLVTHDQDEALSMADRIAALRHGRIAQYATPEELYSRPVDAELAGFIGEANLLDGVLAGGMVDTVLGGLPVDPAVAAADGAVTVLVRPEQIDLAQIDVAQVDRARVDLRPDEGGVTARVVSHDYHGHDVVVHLRPEQAAGERDVIARLAGGDPVPSGSRVTLRTRGPVFAWPKDASG
jgi:iron(III) transport system ATP-binding protein